MKILDFSLEGIQLNGKDLIQIIAAVIIVYDLWMRFLSLESGLLELRISTLDMELSYLEQNHDRSETEQRIYESKRGQVDLLRQSLMEMQQ